MPSSPCIIRTCWKSSNSRHRFPNPSKQKVLFDKWVVLCGNKDLLQLTRENVYQSRRICSLHFLPKDFGNNNKLRPGTLPSVNLPDPLKSSLEACQPASKMPIKINYDIPSTSRHAVKSSIADNLNSQFEAPSSDTEKQFEATTSTTNENDSNSVSLSKSPKRLSILPSGINVSLEDLTLKTKHSYDRAIQFKRRALQPKISELSLQKQLKIAEKCTGPETFEKMVSSMDRIRARFFQRQLENTSKKPRGRRYTTEDKVLALALHKQSSAGYRFLSKKLPLPSRRTVMRLKQEQDFCMSWH